MGTFFGNNNQVSTNRLDGDAKDTGGSYTGTTKTSSSGALDRIKAIAHNALDPADQDTGDPMNLPDAPDVGSGVNQPERSDLGSGLNPAADEYVGPPWHQSRELSLLENGNFETGDLTGWTEVSEVSGGWLGAFVVAENGGEVLGMPDLPFNPDGDEFVAVSEQNGPTFTMIYQTFTVPKGADDLILSYDLLPLNWDVQNIVGLLDVDDQPNQHSRVDILRSGADADSIDGADVVANLFLSDNGDVGGFGEFQSYVFENLLDILTPGESYFIRFAQVDTQFFYNLGVDNVELDTSYANDIGLIGSPIWGSDDIAPVPG